MKGLSHGPRHWVGVGKEYSFCSSFRCEKNLERYLRYKEPCLSLLSSTGSKTLLSFLDASWEVTKTFRDLRLPPSLCCPCPFEPSPCSYFHSNFSKVLLSRICFISSSECPNFWQCSFCSVQVSITSHWSLLQLTITQNLTLVLILCMSYHFLNTCQEKN